MEKAPLIRNHVPATVVGIGAIFAGFGCPRMEQSVRDMLRYQGQRPRILSLVETKRDKRTGGDSSEANGKVESPDMAVSSSQKSNKEASSPISNSRRSSEKSRDVSSPKPTQIKSLTRVQISSASLEDLSTGLAFSLKKKSLFQKRRGSQSSVSSPVDPLSQFVSGSQYFFSETQFLLTLVEISERLRTVPKPARQSTLIAELTLFNHNLPADVCLPLWCPANRSHPHHHRVVRISPSDSVVLNSAERVFFILIEMIGAVPHSCGSS